jgi:hypothetical protein
VAHGKPQGLVGRCAAAFAAHARGVMVHAQCMVTTCTTRMVARLTVDLAWQGEGEGPEVTCGGARQAGCGGDSHVPLVANEGVELKVGGCVLQQRRRMVTGGGRGGLQQCGGGQGGVGGLWRGASHVEER